MEDIKEVKIRTEEWANPTPAGLVALAVACFGFFGFLNGHVDPATAMPLLGCWLIGGFVIQVIVGILDLKEGNRTGGNTFLFFSAFFMLSAGLLMFVKYSTGIADPKLDGFAWSALTLVMFLWLPAFFRPFGILSLVVVAVTAALPFLALVDLGILSSGWAHISGYSLLIAAVLAIYLSAAIVVNNAYGREVYPLLRLKKK